MLKLVVPSTTMNWYATNLKIFHEAAISTPPNYDLMEHIIISTLLKLKIFSLDSGYGTRKPTSKPFVKYALTYNDYIVQIYNEQKSSDERRIFVMVQEDVKDVFVNKGTARNMSSLLGDTINILVREVLRDDYNVLYE